MKISQKKKTILIPAVLLVIIGVVTTAYFVTKNESSTTPQTDEAQVPESIEVSGSKSDPVKPSVPSDGSSTSTKTNSEKKSVKPVITSSGQYGNVVEVSSRVPGVIENGGTCTLSLTRGSAQAVSASRKGTANVSDTSCGYISVSTSKLTAGNWIAVISYSSSKAKGSSSSVSINVK